MYYDNVELKDWSDLVEKTAKQWKNGLSVEQWAGTTTEEIFNWINTGTVAIPDEMTYEDIKMFSRDVCNAVNDDGIEELS